MKTLILLILLVAVTASASETAKKKWEVEHAAYEADQKKRDADAKKWLEGWSDRLVAEERAKKRAKIAKAKKIGGKYANLILKGKAVIGMKREQVKLALGNPRDINRTVGSWGVHEQWVYANSYLYFENGVMTSFQD